MIENCLKFWLTQDCWRLSSLAGCFLTCGRFNAPSQIIVHSLWKLPFPDIFTLYPFTAPIWLRGSSLSPICFLSDQWQSVVGANNQKFKTRSYSFAFVSILQLNPGTLENRSCKQQDEPGAAELHQQLFPLPGKLPTGHLLLRLLPALLVYLPSSSQAGHLSSGHLPSRSRRCFDGWD